MHKIAIIGAVLSAGAAAVDLQYCHGGVNGVCRNITLSTPTLKECYEPDVLGPIGTIDTIVGITSGIRYTIHTEVGCSATSSSPLFGPGVNTLAFPFLNNVKTISASIVWRPVFSCITDMNAGARTLSSASLASSNMTIELCQDFCEAGHFRLAGVEFGTECYCDHYYLFPVSGPFIVPPINCNIPCGGNPAQTCGGASRMNLFNSTIPLPITPSTITDPNEIVWSSDGCWTDNFITDNRTLPIHVEPADGVTPQTCVNACAAAGQTMAGVEFGSECWCGTVRNPNAKAPSGPTTRCKTACQANSTFFCGGPNFINIYNAVNATL